MLAPKPKYDGNIKVQIRLNLAEVGAVNEVLKKKRETKGSITKYTCIFAMHDTHLRKTSLIKHSIKLTE